MAMAAPVYYSGSGGSSFGNTDMQRGQMDEKKTVFSQLRREAQALNVAKQARARLTTWNPGTREGAKGYREKVVRFGRQVGGLLDYFDNKHSPALDIIAGDRFLLKYQIFGDIDREPAFGQNTMTAEVPVTWDKCEVEVKLYAGSLDKLMSRAKLTGSAREGIPNRNDVAKSTGWNQDAVRNFPDNRMESLVSLLEQMQTGQSKLTRLVKGFLLLLEISDRKEVDFHIGDHIHVTYGIQDVCNSYDLGDRCYVFTSKPTSAAHSAVLLAMCRSYPPPQFPSHVKVPADAKDICLVSQGRQLQPGTAVTLNPGLVYSSILTYAMDTSCTGLLQEAQIIACSLQENRYFSRVGLPNVVSLYDLMVPAFVAQSSALETARLSGDLSKAVGRVHQMLGMVAAKDIISATYMQSSRGFDPSGAIRQYLNSNSRLVSQMASKLTHIGLFDATPSLRIFSEMDDLDYADMLNLSIFEGLWLVSDAGASVENGPISFLLNGDKLMSGDRAGYDVLVEELVLANITIEHHKMPTGAFTTRWVAAKRDESLRLRRLPRTPHKVKMVQDCDYTPGLNLKGHGRKARLGGGSVHRRSSSAIPLHQVLRSPPRTDDSSSSRSARWSHRAGIQLGKRDEPPAYESGRSSSPLTTSVEESLSQQEGEHHLFEEEPELPKQQTTIATAARKKLGRATLDKILEAHSEAQEAKSLAVAQRNRRIERMLAPDDRQFTDEEQVDRLLKDGGLSGKERKEWSSLIEVTIGHWRAKEAGGMSDLVALFDSSGREGGLNRVTALLSGNSKHTLALNEIINKCNPGKFESMLSAMVRERGSWVGDIDAAPAEGIKFVHGSESWKQWLGDLGVDADETVFGGQTLGRFLAEAVSRGNCTQRQVRKLAGMVEGMTINLMPPQYTPTDLGNVPTHDLDWRNAPSSLGERPFAQEDGRWLVAAATAAGNFFNVKELRKLCSEFNVPRELRDALREKYGLFDGRKGSL